MKLEIIREQSDDVQTLGILNVIDEDSTLYQCKTLELPWKDNLQNVSCIPEGTYQVVKRKSPKFGEHLHILDVPGRTWILIHRGNFHTDIRGCILVGQEHRDLNMNGHKDVTKSRKTMKEILSYLPDQSEIEIKSE